jgi:NitT/TauT family transport system substrate-binding protein
MCQQSTIDKDPAKVQAYTTACYRAVQWIKKSSAEEILATIEPYVGSTSRESNLLEIQAVKDVTDYDGMIDPAAFERGGKMWFREVSGIKPVKLADAFDGSFLTKAHAKYPG